MGSSPISHPNGLERYVQPLFGRPAVEVSPGAVHIPAWLSLDEQQHLVRAWREWAAPPAGMRHTRMPNGSRMSVQTVCLGWHWQPYRYSRTVDDGDGAPVKPLPGWLADLGRRAVGDACVFRFGNADSRSRPWTDVELASGDLFVFGGPARLAYHGVLRTVSGTAPPELGPTGRLNVTLRESGLS